MRGMNPFEYRPRHWGRLGDASRPRDIGDEWGLPERLYSYSLGGIANTYLRAVHRIQIHNAERLPPSGPFVMVSNHASHLDSLILASALGARNRLRALPIAVSDTFCVRPLSPRFSMIPLGALPLWRRNPGRHTHADLRNRLETEDLIMFAYPEGTRSRDGTMGTFRTGIGMLVAGTSIPVVPCKIRGAFAAFPPEKHLPKSGQISLRIGSPITFPDLPHDEKGWQRTSKRLQAAVYELKH